MTLALTTLHGQARHYAAVRARLWPVPALSPLAPPKPEWSTPAFVPVFETVEHHIVGVLFALDPHADTPEIIRATAHVFRLPAAALKGGLRVDSHVAPRQIAMTIARLRLAGQHRGSLSQIARHFGGRDHSTVHHAIKKYGATVERLARLVDINGAKPCSN